MTRWLAGSMAAAVLSAAGSAAATTILIDISAPDPLGSPFPGQGHEYDFAPVTLHPGDTLDMKVDFDGAVSIDNPDGLPRTLVVIFQLGPDPEGTGYDAGFAHLVYGDYFGINNPASGFEASAELTDSRDRPDFALTLSSALISVIAVPEPAAWALMLVGFGGAGAAMRFRPRGRRQGVLD
jgi:hypothetical protein